MQALTFHGTRTMTDTTPLRDTLSDSGNAFSDDYDSPWKEAVERYFPEFIAFYFPQAHAQIDWRVGYEFLDQELRAVVQDAELGKRFVDKLVRVHRLSGEEDWIYLHLEVQGSAQAEFAERMFVYNYRLYDRYRRPVASMAVLADESENWRPESFGFEVLGCRHTLEFPTAKLLAYAGQEEDLAVADNPFALVTLAHLLTRATRRDMRARFDAKWKLVQLLYRRGWERQEVIDLFHVLDWMMRLPAHLAQELWQNIEVLEEQEKMRYVSSIEQLGVEKGMQQGVQVGESRMLARMLVGRFGELPAWVLAKLEKASALELEAWADAVFAAESLEAVFGPTQH